MRRYLVKVAYLGEGFSGSQAQPPETGLRTVAGEVRSKLLLTDHVPEDRIDLRFASRTDAGVSALGNAIAFYTEFKDPETMLRALNSVSDGVYYLAYREVDDAFNPRIADKRYYRYSCPADRMDLPAFREAAELFEGHHDFKRFAKNETGSKVTKSLVSAGCRIYGTVDGSVLSRNVIVEPGAVVTDSILMQGTVIKSGAVVDHAIIDRNNVIPAGTVLKGTAEDVLAKGKARD